jgi:hypothetical protein
MINTLSRFREMSSGLSATERLAKRYFWKTGKRGMWNGVEKKKEYVSWCRFSRYADRELFIHATVD